ncbi:E3 ubiquitin-protein ligase TRIM11-like [Pyxicephalus adspersus]|uniref:E3 ubiquitin-protein ligase TRIM11-like n=1 Tax=Pyxicephalus adspersus TaxID=30357 RepID=UPI003B59365A
MATAILKEELECSVCLNIFIDPVMLECGHNFCQICMNSVLDTQKGSVSYSCPECRQQFYERPELKKNIKLRNIVENFLSTQSDQEEPSALCPIHKKILEYYCSDDNMCVCVSWCLIGEHKSHKMESLEEASEKKKNKMRNVLKQLLTKKEKTEESVQNLHECRRKMEEKAANGTEEVISLFTDLRRKLKVLENRVLGEISGQTKLATHSMLDLILEMERKKEELSRKMHHIEELCKIMNPLTVLQEPDTGDVHDTEDEDNKGREKHDILLYDRGHLDMAAISQTLQTGLGNIFSGVNVKKNKEKLVHSHFTIGDIGDSIAALFPGVPQAAMQGTHCQSRKLSIQSYLKMWGLSKYTDILLDENTAGNDLCISDNKKIVSFSVFTQKYPEIQERFQSAQVLSTQSFSSGQHHWDVDVGRSQVWSIGMCYPSINRRGCHSDIGWNNNSWGLHKSWLKNQYSVLYDRKWILLPGKVFINRVRIYVDYEAGQISFYDLCDPVRHLHTFNATFAEPLHALLWVGGGFVKICKGNEDM